MLSYQLTTSIKDQQSMACWLYSKSKLANVQFTVGLTKRLEIYPFMKTMSLHPGVVNSEFLANSKGWNMFNIFKTC